MPLTFDLPDQPRYLGDDAIAGIWQNPGFGSYFTDHMAVANWDRQTGWHNDRIVDYAPVAMDPAGAVYHYAQEIFEGLKAYRHADGTVWLFRPQANAARFERSAHRLALPELPAEDFVTSVRRLVEIERRWVPGGEEQSLYLRPFMMASENFLGVRPAHSVLYVVIASPVGAYFTGGVAPVDSGCQAVQSGRQRRYRLDMRRQLRVFPQELARTGLLGALRGRRRASLGRELGGMHFMITTDNRSRHRQRQHAVDPRPLLRCPRNRSDAARRDQLPRC